MRTEPVYVWDLVVRATHWIIALSMVVLAVTGFYIGNPFIVADTASTGGFLMATVKIIHSYAAIAFTLAVLSRVAWMFIGSRHARWDQFIPVNAQRRKDMLGTLSFYLFVRHRPPPAIGHNPLAGATYVAVFGLYFVMIATGFGLYSISAHVGSHMAWFDWLVPVFGGAQGARWLHHVTMWLLIGFVIHHVFSAILMSQAERNATIDSIFSGWKHPDA